MMMSLCVLLLVASMVVVSDATCVGGTYEGCFEDSRSRYLNGYEKKGDSTMTVVKCINICRERNFRYAGVQYATECFCGNKITSTMKPDSDCNMPCKGNKSRICGGSWRNSVYLIR